MPLLLLVVLLLVLVLLLLVLLPPLPLELDEPLPPEPPPPVAPDELPAEDELSVLVQFGSDGHVGSDLTSEEQLGRRSVKRSRERVRDMGRE